MKRLLTKLKNCNTELPIPIGQFLSYIPFKYRPGIGRDYEQQRQAIDLFKHASIEQKKDYIYHHFYRVFKHAYENIPFYNNLYQKAGLSPKSIKRFEDIEKVPIITKDDLINVPLEKRSYPIKNRTLVNTGGSSGKPLSFYMDPKRFGNEWAHIHHIWSQLGYKPHKLKLQFDGRSKVKNLVQYDFVRHSLRFDIYADPEDVVKKLLPISKKHEIEYLHGYPSAIYNFAIFCHNNAPRLQKQLKKSLNGAFLVSEFPNPHFRKGIESIFRIPTQSFYGHTETCAMAYEKEKSFTFNILQSYGYAEAVPSQSDGYNLIGTSYFNFASPLIRYDTEDGISAIERKKGILQKFQITEGRRGEFILDTNNKKISLTGLIFGRHHKIFEYAKHVQVKQEKPGKATILYVSDTIKKIDAKNTDLFDTTNINIDFEFKKIEQPILTKSGKQKLLVNES